MKHNPFSYTDNDSYKEEDESMFCDPFADESDFFEDKELINEIMEDICENDEEIYRIQKVLKTRSKSNSIPNHWHLSKSKIIEPATLAFAKECNIPASLIEEKYQLNVISSIIDICQNKNTFNKFDQEILSWAINSNANILTFTSFESASNAINFSCINSDSFLASADIFTFNSKNSDGAPILWLHEFIQTSLVNTPMAKSVILKFHEINSANYYNAYGYTAMGILNSLIRKKSNTKIYEDIFVLLADNGADPSLLAPNFENLASNSTVLKLAKSYHEKNSLNSAISGANSMKRVSKL